MPLTCVHVGHRFLNDRALGITGLCPQGEGGYRLSDLRALTYARGQPGARFLLRWPATPAEQRCRRIRRTWGLALGEPHQQVAEFTSAMSDIYVYLCGA